MYCVVDKPLPLYLGVPKFDLRFYQSVGSDSTCCPVSCDILYTEPLPVSLQVLPDIQKNKKPPAQY